jgi:hypothetical protein
MAKEPKKGIVYLVQNPAFPHLCKIGRTGRDTIEARGLNASNVPEDFEVLFGYECNNPEEVEKHLHETFENFRHYSKTGRKTEFFYTGCLLKAQRTLTLLSQKTKEIPGEDILLGESDKAEYVGEIPKRKSPFTFDMVNIEPGETLVFTEDEKEECTVESSKTVLYKNKEYSLSKLAKELMEKLGPPNETYQGPKFFKVKNDTETLNEKREKMERNPSINSEDEHSDNRFTFGKVSIEPGTILVFTEDKREECIVVKSKDDRTVRYKNKEYKLAPLVQKLKGDNRSYRGIRFFRIKGRSDEGTLEEIFDRKSKAAD